MNKQKRIVERLESLIEKLSNIQDENDSIKQDLHIILMEIKANTVVNDLRDTLKSVFVIEGIDRISVSGDLICGKNIGPQHINGDVPKSPSVQPQPAGHTQARCDAPKSPSVQPQPAGHTQARCDAPKSPSVQLQLKRGAQEAIQPRVMMFIDDIERHLNGTGSSVDLTAKEIISELNSFITGVMKCDTDTSFSLLMHLVQTLNINKLKSTKTTFSNAHRLVTLILQPILRKEVDISKNIRQFHRIKDLFHISMLVGAAVLSDSSENSLGSLMRYIIVMCASVVSIYESIEMDEYSYIDAEEMETLIHAFSDMLISVE
ncbi:MAG: hypothetical protein ACRCZ9_12090 [Fusobacteriaceae bacterium]